MTAMIGQGCRVDRALATDVAIVCRNPRPDEMDQMCALRGWEQYDPEAATRQIISGMSADCWTLIGHDGIPFAVGGLDLIRPGVLEVWGIGTMAGWDRYWREITRHSRRVVDNALAAGYHRIETVALASRTGAHEWYRRGLRLSDEGPRAGYFANGADGIGFAIVRKP